MCYIKFSFCNTCIRVKNTHVNKESLIKSFIILLIFLMPFSAVSAKNSIKMRADVAQEFTVKNQELPDEISFVITKSKTIPDVISIPENSIVTMKVIKAQRELRWHKSGLILCKLISYTPETSDTPIDISDKDLYLTVRKYEPINKKEAWILGTEIVVFQGASFFAPGVDIGYFFLKGAILRQKHPHWFKAGVRNAYDNSIFWFPQKGKPIELSEGEQVDIKDITQEKAQKLEKIIDKRNARFERQAAKRIARKEAKSFKKELKNDRKLVDCTTVEQAIESVVVDRSVLAKIIDDDSVDENQK